MDFWLAIYSNYAAMVTDLTLPGVALPLLPQSAHILVGRVSRYKMQCKQPKADFLMSLSRQKDEHE